MVGFVIYSKALVALKISNRISIWVTLVWSIGILYTLGIFVLTIARFQRKIRKFRLARSQSVTYVFRYTYCKKKKEKKKAILSTTTENLVTPAPPTPDKGSIREIATVSITLDDHLEGPYLLKTREASGGSTPGPPPGALWRDPRP